MSQLNEVNQHLLCALCSGYLVDATAVIECLHTFCRSCIVRYLESSQTCPVCDVPLHENNPLLGIRSDTTLQRLVYKLVPDVYKEEVQRRFAFFKSLSTGGKTISKEELLKDIDDTKLGQKIFSGDEMFSVCLQYLMSSSVDICKTADVNNDEIAARYLMCPASLTIRHLKKLITNKLDLSTRVSDTFQLQLFDDNELLDDDYTLMDVAYITKWSGMMPLDLKYTLQSPVTSCCSRQSVTSVSKQHKTTVSWRKSFKTKQTTIRKKQSGIKTSHQTDSRRLKETVSKEPAEEQDDKTAETQSQLMTVEQLETAKPVPKIVLSCTHPPKIKSVSANPTGLNGVSAQPEKIKTVSTHVAGLNCDVISTDSDASSFNNLQKNTHCSAVAKKPILPKICLSKSEVSWQKSILSKLRITKASKPGKVFISNVNVSKVNAVKYLFVPKFSLWRDRASVIGLLRKHSKWQQRQMTSSSSHVTSVATELPEVEQESSITHAATQELSTEMKEVVSSSSNSDNVVSSSTSSQMDDDEQRVSCADTQMQDDIVSGSTVTLLRRGAVESETSSVEDKDKPTLCVPIRLGDHGELLLRLPQNVSVECSFRPVVSTHSAPQSDAEQTTKSCCDSVCSTVPLKDLGQNESKDSCVLSKNLEKPSTVSSFATSADSVITSKSLPSEMVSIDNRAGSSNDDESALVSEQPDINLFPFVTVSPSRRKMAPVSSPCVSRAGWTSPLPVVSSSLASPVDTSLLTPDRHRDQSPDTIVTQRPDIIKVPVYTAVFRDRRHSVKTVSCNQSTCIAGALDLTVAPTVKHKSPSRHKSSRAEADKLLKKSVSEDKAVTSELCVSLERCDQPPPPTTKRLKLMCNGMTIYRTLEPSTSKRHRRSSRSKSFELMTNKQHIVGSAKQRHKSTTAVEQSQPIDFAAVDECRQTAVETNCVPECVLECNEPLELTTARARERYQDDDFATALDLSINSA